jgi:hypothetical protein
MSPQREYLGLNLPHPIPFQGIIPFLDNIIGFDDSIIRCNILREAYKKQLVKNGYKTTALNLAFENFPLDFSQNADLLGQYISQLPFTPYLEKPCGKKNLLIKLLEKTCGKKNLLIKLNQESENKELNFLSRILRQNINFEDLILVFDYKENKNKNFLSLNHIIYKDCKITKCDTLWVKLLQSAYTELFLVISIEHSLWHLNVAFIINAAQNSLQTTEILKIFNMAEDNVFEKATEDETI